MKTITFSNLFTHEILSVFGINHTFSRNDYKNVIGELFEQASIIRDWSVLKAEIGNKTVYCKTTVVESTINAHIFIDDTYIRTMSIA